MEAQKVKCIVDFDPSNPKEIKAGTGRLLERADRDHDLVEPARFSNAKGLGGERSGVDRQLRRYLDDMSGRARGAVKGVLLELNDYAKLGIGLVSVRPIFLDRDGIPVSLPNGELAHPTIGAILPPMPGKHPQALVAFGVGNGTEEFTPTDRQISGRTFSPGEEVPANIQSLASEWGFRPDQQVVVSAPSSIAVSVPVLDQKALDESGLKYAMIEDPNRRVQESRLYVCRYRTRQAALQAMGIRVND